MAQTIRWSPEAVEDIEHHAEFIERDSPHYASVVASRIVESLQPCADHPHIGRQVPEMSNPEYRERLVYRYRVIYRIREDHILVVAVIHGSQDFEPHISRITGASET